MFLIVRTVVGFECESAGLAAGLTLLYMHLVLTYDEGCEQPQPQPIPSEPPSLLMRQFALTKYKYIAWPSETANVKRNSHEESKANNFTETKSKAIPKWRP